jgi:hypothetical protein
VNEQITPAANQLAEQTNSDILLCSGGIHRPFDDKLLDELATLRKRENVTLLLCTHGGNPDVAYRMARALQDNYKKFTVVLAGRCKSAGTLLVVGAHEIVMTPHAELGPLDIQLGKKDEIFELDSGLTVLDALTELENKAFELFEKAMIRIKVRSEGSVTLKTATHIATELAKGVIAPIMAQIDPMHIGEVSRALKIGKEYGERLSSRSLNLYGDSLEKLVERYPSHGFVIDSREARELFVHVRDATPEEANLIKLAALRGSIRIPNEDGTLSFLSDTRKEEVNDSDNAQDAGAGSASTEAGSTPIEELLGREKPSRPGAISAVQGERRTGTK